MLAQESKVAATDRFHSAAKPTTEEVLDYYNKWARNYDNDSVTVEYIGAELVAQYASEYLKDKSTKIIDICAGTGSGAEELRKQGFFNIDALDGAGEMLEVAKEKQLYSEYFCAYLNPGEQTQIPADHYGAVICIGSFLGGHLKPEVADEFLRILKPGGYCIIGMREQWLYDAPEYKDRLEPYLTNLKGWKMITRDVVKNWFDDLNGVIWVFQKI